MNSIINNTKHSEQEASKLYLGLMSGTSIDGVDVALVDFYQNQHRLIDSYLHPIDLNTKTKLRSLCSLKAQENHIDAVQHRIELLGELDYRMGCIFADSVNQLLTRKKLDKNAIIAIGSHGQTIRHQPARKNAFTLQIGDPNIIAYQTGIKTVSDFRRMDMAAGGQGAPLAPGFHNASMRDESENRIILNLGGIANITLLPRASNKPISGFDTGTANTLLDVWYLHNHPDSRQDYDHNAEFARQGKIHLPLLEQLLRDPYFELAPPKSTGREYFSIEWLWQQIEHVQQQTSAQTLKAEDVQRTLLEFTAMTISQAIFKLQLKNFQVYTCGGGRHNYFLINRIEQLLKQPVYNTDKLGIDGDYLEAMTFAWLASRRIDEKPGNLPSVTGAREAKILGAIYLP